MPSALKFVKLQQIISIPYNSCNNGLKGHIIGEKDASKMFCNWNKKKNKVKGKKKKKGSLLHNPQRVWIKQLVNFWNPIKNCF